MHILPAFFGSALLAATPAPSTPETAAAIVHELHRELETLRAERADVDRRRETELRLLAADVIEHSSRRLSLRDDRLLRAGPKGFELRSADDDFSLEVEGQLQVRWALSKTTVRNDRDSTRSGFELRRTKLSFSGHVVDRDWRYRVKMAFGSDSGDARLQSVWLRRRLSKHWDVRGGQFKLALLREERVSSRRQLLVERSLVDREFRPGFSKALEIVGRSDHFGLTVAVSDGLRSSNTDALARDVEYAFTGRVEWQSGDDWSRFSDFTSPPGSGAAVLLGAAAHVEREESGGDRSEERLWRWTADASLELDGANLFAAVIGDRIEAHSGPHETRIGFVAHGGLYVHDSIEIFARYEYGDAGDASAKLSVVTTGFNWYRNGHRLKTTADIGYAFNGVTRTWASDGAAWRRDRDDDDGQIVARLQLQLLF